MGEADLLGLNQPEPDPVAPYGLRADGTPRGKPGRPPKTTTGGGRPKTTPPPPPRKATSGRKPPPGRPDYRPGIVALLSLPVGILAAAGASMHRPELVADAATIAAGAPAVAQALDEMAASEPGVAAVLDWVLTAGPYGALVGAVTPMVAQLCVNHGWIKAGMLGTVTPDEMLASFARRNGSAPGAGPDHPTG